MSENTLSVCLLDEKTKTKTKTKQNETKRDRESCERLLYILKVEPREQSLGNNFSKTANDVCITVLRTQLIDS